jgi:phage tail-like protein
MPQTATREDPALNYKFYVEIQGIYVAEFTECGGIEMEREVETYAEGGINDFVHQLPGRVKYSDITLKNGLTYSHDLWLWFRQGLYDGKVKKMAFSIILGNAEGLKVKQWEVVGAFPKKWKGPTLQSASTETAVQEITLAHHGLTLSTDTGSALRT